MLAMRSGTVDMMFATPFEFVDCLEQKVLLPLALTHTERIPFYPNVRTCGEYGLQNIVNLSLITISPPAGAPDFVVRTLNRAVIEAIAGRPGKAPLTPIGRESPPFDPEELATFVEKERRRWGEIITNAKYSA